MMMTPPYFGGAGAAPYQAPQVTVLPQPTGSQPCVITVPMGGAGTGSQTNVIPLPIPTPLPIPVTGSGSGGGTVIFTGNAQPPPAPYPPPYQYPTPQQQPQSNGLADSAALMMMMQQIRSMTSPRGGRVKNRKAHVFSPEEVTSPPFSPEAAVPLAKKKREKSSADKKGHSRILSPGNEVSDEEKGVKKPADEKGEDVAAVKAQEQKDEKKEPEGDAPKTKEGTQEGETMGKGPDSGAPALSLNFPSTVALGQETATAEDDTEVPRGYSFFGICCYAVFVAFLVCLVTLAVAPTLLRALLDALGLVKHNEKKPGAGGIGSDSTNETQHSNAFAIDEVPTQAPFFDLGETFGEIGIDDEFRDGEFAALVTKPTYVGSIIDWLLNVGLNPGAEHEVTTTTAPRFPLPYWKKRLLNRENHNVAQDHSASKAGRPPYGFILPLGDNSAAYMNAAGGSEGNTGTNNKSNAHNLTSTAVKVTPAGHTRMRTTIFESSTANIEVSTKSPIRELIDSLLRRRSHASTAATTLWPLQDRLQYLPKTVYFEWFPTQTSPTMTARRNRSRRRGKGITLSFRLPEVPTRDIGKIVFYKVFRDFGYEETTHA
ncbi:hypothetical protein V5799_020075 [Amblyomma americanum]|uniref:Uncharacterized protein n=1 Tax=Amblyomma americanum TaxID=6943 RepID=A0AAQ4EVU0_AMBAM